MRKPVDDDQAGPFLLSECAVDSSPFLLDIEGNAVLGRGDDDKDVQRSADDQWARWIGNVEISHYRSAVRLREEAVPRPVIEEFPRQAGKPRRVSQPKA